MGGGETVWIWSLIDKRSVRSWLYISLLFHHLLFQAPQPLQLLAKVYFFCPLLIVSWYLMLVRAIEVNPEWYISLGTWLPICVAPPPCTSTYLLLQDLPTYPKTILKMPKVPRSVSYHSIPLSTAEHHYLVIKARRIPHLTQLTNGLGQLWFLLLGRIRLCSSQQALALMFWRHQLLLMILRWREFWRKEVTYWAFCQHQNLPILINLKTLWYLPKTLIPPTPHPSLELVSFTLVLRYIIFCNLISTSFGCTDAGAKSQMATFWGVTCCCSSRTPKSPALWDHCEFLRNQGISYYHYLGLFVCVTHGYLIHPFHLQVHLENHKLNDAAGKQRLTSVGWTSLMQHISQTFKVAVKPKPGLTSIFPEIWTTIDVPVPGLPVIIGFKCILCDGLFGKSDSIRVHYYTKHKGEPHISPKSSDSRVPIQRLFSNSLSALNPPLFPKGSGQQFFQISCTPGPSYQHMDSTEEAQVSSFLTHSLQITTVPSYISALGWLECLQSTQLSPQFLAWLVAIPKKATTTGDENSDPNLQLVEEGLLKTKEHVKAYLDDADLKLSSMVQGVRDVIRGK